ncbi:adenylate/guanylate cyclase domain-containing protein [Pirellulales bacterium]|nr:adenylate/guanylate cyclase domain-containing protein [Pirellulales bacterium]
MAELVAIGKDSQPRWRQALPEGETIVLGRAPRNGWSVPWDRLISREHAHLCLQGSELTVHELATARNPIIYRGEPAQELSLAPAEEFRIGETTFRFEVAIVPEPAKDTVVEHSLGRSVFNASRFAQAGACLEALCRMPDLMAQSASDVEFATQLADLLLNSLRGALAAAVMQFRAQDSQLDVVPEPTLLRWNVRGETVTRFRPSRRLMNRAFEQQQSVVHLWSEQDADDPQFTMTGDLDWAVCTPIPTSNNEKWCLYISGRRAIAGLHDITKTNDLMAELQLVELIAKFIGAVRQIRCLEKQQTAMRQFFSPAVVETLTSEKSDEALAPRQGPISVLFCDVRGFSRKVEAAKEDLYPLLGRVSCALSVMTQCILKFEGVIADFQGDAALGFWGWPSRSDDAALNACKAALLIHQRFDEANQSPDDPLYGFRVGIGIGHGDAIAGRIGSEEQIKVGVFGPVVNLASRLQDLTKQAGVPILVDAPTAAAIENSLPDEASSLRRLATIRPRGIATPVEPFALIPRRLASDPLTDEQLQAYEQAINATARGDWAEAMQLLRDLPPQDGPANLLRSELCSQGPNPPDKWDGALSLSR